MNDFIRINRVRNLLSSTQFTKKVTPKERKRISLLQSENNLPSLMNDQILLRRMKGKI